MYETRIVTACTPDYAERAERLRAQAEAHGVQVEVIPYEPVGDWLQNVRHRIRVFRDALHQGRPCFWVDGDAEILRPFPPEFMRELEAHWDIAAPLIEQPAPRPRRYRAGVFWFAPTAYAVADEWADMCDGPEDGEDEKFLEVLRRKYEHAWRWGVLPDEYCWVPGIHPMPPPPEVVILTHSAKQNPFSSDGVRRRGVWPPCSS